MTDYRNVKEVTLGLSDVIAEREISFQIPADPNTEDFSGRPKWQPYHNIYLRREGRVAGPRSWYQIKNGWAAGYLSDHQALGLYRSGGSSAWAISLRRRTTSVGGLMSAHEKGLEAVIEVLQDAYEDRDPTGIARDVIDAYYEASNPYDGSETIYDDYYRLKAVALGILALWDEGPHYRDPALPGAMEGLRALLLVHDDRGGAKLPTVEGTKAMIRRQP